MSGHHDDQRNVPRDFCVADILRAPAYRPQPLTDQDVERAEGLARTALWEMDFALLELDWLTRGVAREAALVESIAGQLMRCAGCLERYPVDLLPLPEALAEALGDRFRELTDMLAATDTAQAPEGRVTTAYERLRTSLELRGVMD